MWGLLVSLGLAAAPSVEILTANSFKLDVRRAELVGRNPNFGRPTRVDLTFIQWMDVDDGSSAVHSTVGLTPAGQVYHLVGMNGRYWVRALGGSAPMREIGLLQRTGPSGGREQVLVGMEGLPGDTGPGRLGVFHPDVWQENPARRLILKRLGYWALSTMAILAAAVGYDALDSVWDYRNTALMTSFGAVSMGLLQALLFANDWGEVNTKPDGFLRTSGHISQLRSLSLESADAILEALAPDRGLADFQQEFVCQMLFHSSLEDRHFEQITER